MTATSHARADGDEFFGFQSKGLNPDGTRAPVTSGFFGSVKDDRGNYLEDAALTLAITVPTDEGPRRITFNAYTNVLGRYHTLDLAVVVFDLLGIETEVDPTSVELVSVKKAGYVEMRRFNRSKAGQPGPKEIDFTMRKSD